MRRLAPAVAFGLLCALAACQKDPSAPETHIENLSDKSVKVRLTALERLRKLCDKKDAAPDPACVQNRNAKAIPAIVPLLKETGQVRTDAVKTLGSFEDPSTAPALIDAIDLGVGAGSDKASKEANEANKEIAEALGALGDKNAVQPLANLAARSKDNFVRVAAINALGQLGDTRAVEPLVKLATDESLEPYVNKKAIQALGNIGDPAATPAIVKMLFHERKGISFYPESSFAVYQIGPSASAPLLEILDGKNEELKKWATEHDVFLEATYAKAAQVLGDLGEKQAAPQLTRYLDYKHEDALRELLVRMQAADALGRMRVADASDDIAKKVDEEEANVRSTYTRALVMIGDKKVVPQLIACAEKGDPEDNRVQAREACYVALSQLGEEKALAQWEAWEKAEPKASVDRCMKSLEADDEAGKKKMAEHCQALGEAVVGLLKAHKSRLVAYGACKQDVDCWTKKLKDTDPKVRERAAFELGRIGDPKAADALVDAMKDTDLNARYIAFLAGDWLVTTGKDGLQAMKKNLPKLEAQLEAESGKVHYVKVNEDLKRLTVRIKRLDKQG